MTPQELDALTDEELNRAVAQAMEPEPSFDWADGRSVGGWWHRTSLENGSCIVSPVFKPASELGDVDRLRNTLNTGVMIHLGGGWANACDEDGNSVDVHDGNECRAATIALLAVWEKKKGPAP